MATKKKYCQAIVRHKGFTRVFTDIEVLYERKSGKQRIIVGRSPLYGKLLIIDNEIQFTESCHAIYDGSFVCPAMIARRGDNVAVYGGGDLLLASEINNFGITPTVVDFDKSVVRVCRKYFPDLVSKRANVRYEDVLKHVPVEKYYVILFDTTDQVSCGSLFTEQAIEKVKGDLAPGGIIVFYAEPKMAAAFYRKVGKFFRYQTLYGAPMHFVGSYFTYGMFSDEEIDVQKIRQSGPIGEYFSGKLFHEIDERFMSFFEDVPETFSIQKF